MSRVEEEGGGVGRLEQEDALSSGENTPGRGLPLMGASGNGQMQQVSSKLVGGGLSKEDKGGSSNDSNSNDGWSDEQADANVCSICMDHAVAVLVAGCAHGLCIQCAFQLCAKGRDLPCCPFCRQKIHGFDTAPGTAAAD